jgi:hypothetical protein
MRPLLPDGARPTNLTRAHTLRDAAFHTGPFCIFGPICLRVLPCSPGLQRFVLRLRPHSDRPAWGCRACTVGTTRTDLTIFRPKLDLDHLILEFIDRGCPTHTCFPFTRRVPDRRRAAAPSRAQSCSLQTLFPLWPANDYRSGLDQSTHYRNSAYCRRTVLS